MDLSSGFDIRNPYGLLASDFGHAMDEYEVALRFLGDQATGTEEAKALEQNGGDVAMLRRWEANGKFRRVLRKARAAGAQERAHTPPEPEPEDQPQGQGFVTLEEGLDKLNARRSIFARNAPRGSWGAP